MSEKLEAENTKALLEQMKESALLAKDEEVEPLESSDPEDKELLARLHGVLQSVSEKKTDEKTEQSAILAEVEENFTQALPVEEIHGEEATLPGEEISAAGEERTLAADNLEESPDDHNPAGDSALQEGAEVTANVISQPMELPLEKSVPKAPVEEKIVTKAEKEPSKDLAENASNQNPKEELSESKQEQTEKEQPAPIRIYERIDGKDAYTQVLEKHGLSAEDVEIMLSLGYEPDLGRLIGFDLLTKLKTERLLRREQSENEQSLPFSCRASERDGLPERTCVLANYAKETKLWKIRLLLTILFTLLCAAFEGFFNVAPTGILLAEKLPVFRWSLEMLFLLSCAGCSYRTLLKGTEGFLKLSVTPFSVLPFLFFFCFTYEISRLFFKGLISLSIAPLMCIVFLSFIILEGVTRQSESSVYKLITSKGNKFVLKPTPHIKKQLHKGKSIVKIVNDNLDETLYRVRQAFSISGFFRRYRDLSNARRPFKMYMYGMIVVTLIHSFIVQVLSGDAATSVCGAAFILLLTAPMLAVYSYFTPLCRANRILLKKKCALIGEESVEEYYVSKRIIFDEEDLFHADYCKRIYSNEGMETKESKELVNCFLKYICGVSEAGVKTDSHHTLLLQVTDNTAEAMLDHEHTLFAGNAISLNRKGIRVPQEMSGKIFHRAENVGVVYIAMDGVLHAGFEISYSINPKFSRTVSRLKRSGSTVAIRSFDPCINESFIRTLGIDANGDITVLKLGRYEATEPVRIADSGIVVLGGKTNLPRPLYAVNQIHTARSIANKMQWCSFACGTAIALLLELGVWKLDFPMWQTAVVLLHHTFWVGLGQIPVVAAIGNRIRLQRNRNS